MFTGNPESSLFLSRPLLTPHLCPRSESSEESSSAQAQLDIGQARRSSQFLVTPTENLDILREAHRRKLKTMFLMQVGVTYIVNNNKK